MQKFCFSLLVFVSVANSFFSVDVSMEERNNNFDEKTKNEIFLSENSFLEAKSEKSFLINRS
jgi:hypothetical protein